jgi:hypothetical protein
LGRAQRTQARRIVEGVEDVIATGDLRRVPSIFVTGRNDGILPPNHTSRAYFGLNNVVEGSISPLRYYEVTNAHHLDSFNQFPTYNAMFIPLHRYFKSGYGPDVRASAARAAAAAEPGRPHDPARTGRAADHAGERAGDRGLPAGKRPHHVHGWTGEHSGIDGQGNKTNRYDLD